MTQFGKKIVSAAVIGACFLGGPAVFRPTAARAAAPAAEKKEPKKADTELAKQMEVIDQGMKKLRRSLRQKEQNAQSLELITQMQAAALACKAQTPVMTPTIPEAQRAKWLADYRKQMAQLLSEITNMEVALLDGDNEKAQQIHKKLGEMEDAGHEKFTQ